MKLSKLFEQINAHTSHNGTDDALLDAMIESRILIEMYSNEILGETAIDTKLKELSDLVDNKCISNIKHEHRMISGSFLLNNRTYNKEFGEKIKKQVIDWLNTDKFDLESARHCAKAIYDILNYKIKMIKLQDEESGVKTPNSIIQELEPIITKIKYTIVTIQDKIDSSSINSKKNNTSPDNNKCILKISKDKVSQVFKKFKLYFNKAAIKSLDDISKTVISAEYDKKSVIPLTASLSLLNITLKKIPFLESMSSDIQEQYIEDLFELMETTSTLLDTLNESDAECLLHIDDNNIKFIKRSIDVLDNIKKHLKLLDYHMNQGKLSDIKRLLPKTKTTIDIDDLIKNTSIIKKNIDKKYDVVNKFSNKLKTIINRK